MKNMIEHVRIHAYGDASQLKTELLEVAPPPPGHVRIRHTAVGVNFVDIYHRTGLYPLPSLPSTLGVEGSGIIEAVGDGVPDALAGRRVAYAVPYAGAYAAARNLPVERILLLPNSIPLNLAAGVMLRGITAHMLFSHVRAPTPGDTVLVHAAAGGLGLILTQWAKSLGLRVIGTVSSRAKAELAMQHGLDRAVLYREEDFVSAARDFTGGAGVCYAIDGVGGETFKRTLDAVRPYGMVASIGQVAGDIGLIAPSDLGPYRSIAVSRPGVFRFMSDLGRYREGTEAVLARLQDGLRVEVGAILPLAEATNAHRLIESGRTSGVLLLQPG
jgi:NADPH2:quinone reductase